MIVLPSPETMMSLTELGGAAVVARPETEPARLGHGLG